jgi:hypothetical protein
MVQTFRTGRDPPRALDGRFGPQDSKLTLRFPMSVRDLAGAMCDMQSRSTPEDHQTEEPPYDATTVIAPRRELIPGAVLPFALLPV